MSGRLAEPVSGAMKSGLIGRSYACQFDTIRGQAFGLGYVVLAASGFFLRAFAWLAADPDHPLTTPPSTMINARFQERKINWYKRLLHESTLAQEDA